MQVNVVFHGGLANKFGEGLSLEVKDVTDCVRGLVSIFGHEMEMFLKNHNWNIHQKDTESDEITEYTEDTLKFPLIKEELHFYPAITGAGGNAGTLQIIVGVVLIIAAIVITVATFGGAAALAPLALSTTSILATAVSVATILSIAAAGVASIVSGVAYSDPKANLSESEVDKNPSFTYNGAINATQQGHIAPIVCGRHFTGSVVASTTVQLQYRVANANLIPAKDSTFPDDNDVGAWTGVNAVVRTKGGILAVEPAQATGYGEYQIPCEQGETYIISCLAEPRKNTPKVWLECEGVIDENIEKTYRHLKMTVVASSNTLSVKLHVQGTRGRFDDVYVSRNEYNYVNDPNLVDLDQASGVFPNG